MLLLRLAALASSALILPRPFTANAADSTSPPQAAPKSCGTVTVAAAAELMYAMNEIAANFEKPTGCSVRVSTGSSGNFLSPIENGAPFDVLFSAVCEYAPNREA